MSLPDSVDGVHVIKIGLIHLTQRYDSWGKYILWGLRRYFPQHTVEMCALDVDVGEFQWAPSNCDVYIRIEDSDSYHTPEAYRPLVYWCGDTHIQDGVPRKQIARDADFTFVAQKNAVGEIGDEWLSHAAWYAFEPEKTPRLCISSAVTLDTANPIFAPRTRIAKRIVQSFDEVYIRGGIYFKEMSNMYANSLMVWNHPVNNDIGMRVMEGFACGACVVTGRIKDNGLEDVFGDELVLQYDTEEECLDLIQKGRADPADCRERGRAGREIVMRGELYKHRLQQLVKRCELVIEGGPTHGDA